MAIQKTTRQPKTNTAKRSVPAAKGTAKRADKSRVTKAKTKRSGKPLAVRSARLEARISPENHVLLKRAAEIQGKTVTEFVTSVALEAAHHAIAEVEIIRLSRENQERFVAALLAPVEPPNTALQKAFATHKARVRE